MKLLLIGCLLIVGMALASLCALVPQAIQSFRFIDNGQVEVATTGSVNALYRLEFSPDSVNWEEHGWMAITSNTTEGSVGTITVSGCTDQVIATIPVPETNFAVSIAGYPSTGLSGSVDQVVASVPMVDSPQTIIFTDAVPANVSQGFWRITAQTAE